MRNPRPIPSGNGSRIFFAEFYEMHQDEQLHFRILTDSTSQVMRWVKNGTAEHMSGMQKSSRDSGKQMRDILPEPAKEAEKLHALRYIQMGQDEFSG